VNRIYYISQVNGFSYFQADKENYVIVGNTSLQVNIPKMKQVAGMVMPGPSKMIFRYPYLIRIDSNGILSYNFSNGMRSTTPFSAVACKWMDYNNSSFMTFEQLPDKLILYNMFNNKSKTLTFTDKNAIAFNLKQIITTDENVQITTENGLLVYDRNLNCIDSFSINTRANDITSIFRDNAANIWMISAQNGLRFFNNYYRTSKYYPNKGYQQLVYLNNHLYIQDIDGNVAVADLDFKIQQQLTVDNISSTQRNIRNCSLLATNKGIYTSNSKNIALLKDGKVQSLLQPGVNLNIVASIKNICYVHDTLYALFYDGLYFLDEKKKVAS